MRYIFGFCLALALSALLSGCATGQHSKTPFELAVDSGDDAAVTKAIAGIRDLNAPESHSPLGYAAYNGTIGLVKLLLEKGARVDPPESDAWIPLMAAANKGDLEIVKLFLERGADVKRANKYGYTALMNAAMGGRLEIVKLLVAKGSDLHAVVNYERAPAAGLTAVGCAAEYNHPEVVKYLIEAGSDVESSIVALDNYAKFLAQYRFPDRTGTISNGLAIQMLKRLSPKPISPGAPTAGLSRGEMEQIVKSAMATSQPAPAGAPPEIKSDVDAPSYKAAVNPDAFAVVVGAEKYNTLPEARFAERDAKAMNAHLLAMGYPQRNVILLTGSQATKTGLVKNLEAWLPNNATERSTVFFYFSGHGAPDANTSQAYLVPIDGDPQYLEETAYPIKRLYEKLAALKAKRVVVALDSCFSGTGGRSVLAQGTRPLVAKLRIAPGAGKIVALSASSAEEITGALEEQGHGLFTYQLLKALGETAGRGTVSEVYGSLKPRVQDEARRQNRAQTPQISGSSLEAGFR